MSRGSPKAGCSTAGNPGRYLPRNAKLTLGRNTPRRFGFFIHGSGITPFHLEIIPRPITISSTIFRVRGKNIFLSHRGHRGHREKCLANVRNPCRIRVNQWLIEFVDSDETGCVGAIRKAESLSVLQTFEVFAVREGFSAAKREIGCSANWCGSAALGSLWLNLNSIELCRSSVFAKRRKVRLPKSGRALD
ncbi:MAG TPA: hypothetical protein VHB77_17650 [Planctomycetaceae bacterium]|nr:hypothetical protein [Planctomycetaceae bacterium]